MKVTIEIEDKREITVVLKANDMANFIFELQNNFFRKYKHLEEEPTYDQIQHDLLALMDEYDIDSNEFE